MQAYENKFENDKVMYSNDFWEYVEGRLATDEEAGLISVTTEGYQPGVASAMKDEQVDDDEEIMNQIDELLEADSTPAEMKNQLQIQKYLMELEPVQKNLRH